MTQFFADPARLERSRADHNRVGRGFINCFSDVRIEQAARKEFPRVDPRSDGMIAECLLQRANDVVVFRAMGDEELAHSFPIDTATCSETSIPDFLRS